ncbi:MAG: hypothetical protein Rubg2KO_27870 [Rubricoccaceae bacterium]
MRLFLLSLLLASAVHAQSSTPFEVNEGDRVRIWLDSAADVAAEGRVADIVTDSLTLVFMLEGVRTDQSIAWGDVGRMERQRQNWIGELVGMTAGLAVGVLVGGAIGWEVAPHSFGGPIGGGIVGGFTGVTVGASVGVRTLRPWLDVPRNQSVGPPVSMRIAFPLR